MSVQHPLSTLVESDGFFAAILMALLSYGGVSRFGECPHYCVTVGGDEILLTDAHRTALEAAIGTKLLEQKKKLRSTTMHFLELPPSLTAVAASIVEKHNASNPEV